MKFHVHSLSPKAFQSTVFWAALTSTVIVTAAALLGRAAHNFRAAMTDKPDIAIYMLLPDEGLTTTQLLRGDESERDYLAETVDGPKFIKLKKGEKEWFVSTVEKLHPKGPATGTGEQL